MSIEITFRVHADASGHGPVMTTRSTGRDRPPIGSGGASRIDPRQRVMLFALALGTFAIGTEGFMIAAILPTVAESLDVELATAGQLVTVFTLAYALSSPLLTVATGGLPRRRLLTLSLAGFTAANLLAAAAPSYGFLAAARVLLAMAAGLYVPNATAVGSALVPAAYRGRALAIVSGGITVAVAVGVPLGATVSENFGWRSTFLAVAALSALALSMLAWRLPAHPEAGPPANVRVRLATLRLPGAAPVLATTTVWATGAYAVYTYVAPFLTTAAGIPAGQVAAVLSVLGLSALLGIAAGGSATDRHGARRVIALALPAFALAFAGLFAAALTMAMPAYAVLPLVVVWGVSGWAFMPAQQTRLIGIAGPGNASVILSLNASAMYLGFSLGAALGALVVSCLPVAWIGLAGAGCVLAAAGLSRWAWSRART